MKFYRLSDAAFYDCIDTIYQFIKSFFDKKYLFLRDMEPIIITAVDILLMLFGFFLFCFFFSKKISLDISYESSAKQMIHMKCQDLFSLKLKKKKKIEGCMLQMLLCLAL